ncbi:YciK family oxidoreductase [Marinimicrobium agarilyticum]|uniref:YciK family oxidoreductase n=1 Tax=Marinimicrobium agarilyticum TaxID=306546 RepID=UPI00041777C3|nr:YciK family oxidoreductase [Marinimicrobium agarilyticum]
MKVPENYQPAPSLLKDKIIVVTGAGDGIGRVAAKTFAEYRATVVLLGRTMAKLERVYDEIEDAGGPQPAIYPINLEGATEKDYIDLSDALHKEFGKVDGLLHNASELGERTPLANYAPDTWQRVMQVNVNAPFLLTQALLPLMEKAENASIVFTSSGVAQRGRAFWGAYAASKAAQDNLMQTLADELGGALDIRANSINPGATRTRMRAAAYPAEDPNTLPAPEDHMPLYLYLIGEDSVGVNGEIFTTQ